MTAYDVGGHMPTLAEALQNSGQNRYRLRAEVLLETLDAETAETLRGALHDRDVGPVTLSKALMAATGETLSGTAIDSYRSKHGVTR